MPLLSDLVGLLIVLAIWAAALLSPLHAAPFRDGLTGAAFCGTPPVDGMATAIKSCHLCFMPALVLPEQAAASQPETAGFWPYHWVGIAFALTPEPPRYSPIRAPPRLVLQTLSSTQSELKL